SGSGGRRLPRHGLTGVRLAATVRAVEDSRTPPRPHPHAGTRSLAGVQRRRRGLRDAPSGCGSSPGVRAGGSHRCLIAQSSRLTLGYREARAAASSWLLHEGETLRGHEFHYSTWEDRPDNLPPAYVLTHPRGQEPPRPEGACLGNLWASYVHLHFWSRPELAE